MKAAGIVAVTVIAYLPAMRGGFIWDDNDYVTENACLRTPAGLAAIWTQPQESPQYYPLVFTTFWVEFHLWGLRPAGYHIVNVLLHALAAVLLWRLLRRLAVPGAYLAGLLFALHPVCVESVAWITERKNVLSCALYLGAFLAYLRFDPTDAGPAPQPRRWRWYLLAAALFAAALASKTVTFSLPAAIAVTLWYKRRRLDWRTLWPLAPLMIAGLAMGYVTAMHEKHHVGAAGAEWALSMADRVLVAGRALWFYVSKLVLPSELTFFYPRWQIDAGQWWQWLFPASAAGAIAGLWLLRGRLGRGPLAAVLVFAGTLVPALGFFDVYPMRFSFVADHFQYHAMMALLALAAAGAAVGWQRVKARPWRAAMSTVGVGLLLAMGILTWGLGGVYKDLETLYSDTLSKNDTAWVAHNNLGFELLGQRRYAEAQQHLERAIQLRPGYADAYNNLGGVMMGQHRYPEALAVFDRAIEGDPNLMCAHYNSGNVLILLGRLDEAKARLEKALSLDPGYFLAHRSLGELYLRQRLWVPGQQAYERALAGAPADVISLLGLATSLDGQRQYGRACEAYRRVLAVDDRNAIALYNLSCIRSSCIEERMRDGNEALALATLLKSQSGQELRALDAEAMALAELGRFEQAIALTQQAIEKALAAGDRDRAGTLQQRLPLYQSRTPIRIGQ